MRGIRRAGAVLGIGLGLAATPAFASCNIVTPSTADVGTFSPAAVATGAVPYVATTGSFGCTNGSVLSLLAADYLRATVKAGTVLTLTSAAGGTATYLLSANQAGTAPLTPGTRRSYMEGTTLSLLTSKSLVPIYIKPGSAANLAPGTYTGSFDVLWSWKFCNGVAVLGVCLLADVDSGDKTATVTVKLEVADKGAIVSISQKTTWDTTTSTTNPKATPGSKLRLMMTIQNPDIVPLDLDTLAVTLPTPAGLRIALDGDGTGTGAVVQGADSTGTTNLQFTYTSPSSTTDDVDFSSGGNIWGYVPTPGDPTTQGMVTAVRFTPRGKMAAGTAYTISIPYSVK